MTQRRRVLALAVVVAGLVAAVGIAVLARGPTRPRVLDVADVVRDVSTLHRRRVSVVGIAHVDFETKVLLGPGGRTDGDEGADAERIRLDVSALPPDAIGRLGARYVVANGVVDARDPARSAPRGVTLRVTSISLVEQRVRELLAIRSGCSKSSPRVAARSGCSAVEEARAWCTARCGGDARTVVDLCHRPEGVIVVQSSVGHREVLFFDAAGTGVVGHRVHSVAGDTECEGDVRLSSCTREVTLDCASP